MNDDSRTRFIAGGTARYVLSILRIVAAFMFMQSGTMKIFAWPMGMPPDNSTAELLTQVGVGGMLEVVGGALMLIGLFARPVAFILSGTMAVAYFQFHQPMGLWPVENGGVAAVLYCFLWLYYAAAGAGVWSVDEWRRGRYIPTTTRTLNSSRTIE